MAYNKQTHRITIEEKTGEVLRSLPSSNMCKAIDLAIKDEEEGVDRYNDSLGIGKNLDGNEIKMMQDIARDELRHKFSLIRLKEKYKC